MECSDWSRLLSWQVPMIVSGEMILLNNYFDLHHIHHRAYWAGYYCLHYAYDAHNFFFHIVAPYHLTAQPGSTMKHHRSFSQPQKPTHASTVLPTAYWIIIFSINSNWISFLTVELNKCNKLYQLLNATNYTTSINTIWTTI